MRLEGRREQESAEMRRIHTLPSDCAGTKSRKPCTWKRMQSVFAFIGCIYLAFAFTDVLSAGKDLSILLCSGKEPRKE